jgi:hypothetical protein
MLVDAYGVLIPTSRIEQYLAKISGDNINIEGSLLTRAEYNLNEIVKNGGAGKSGDIVSVVKITNDTDDDAIISVNSEEYTITSGETSYIPLFQIGLVSIEAVEPSDINISHQSLTIEEKNIYEVRLFTIDFSNPECLTTYGLVLSNTIGDSVSFRGRYASFTSDQPKILCAGLGSNGSNSYICLSKNDIPSFNSSAWGDLITSRNEVTIALQKIGINGVVGSMMRGAWSDPVSGITYSIKGSNYSSTIALISNIWSDEAVINNAEIIRLACALL